MNILENDLNLAKFYNSQLHFIPQFIVIIILFRSKHHHTHTKSNDDTKFPVRIEEWLKNIHTKFEACSYHSFNDMRDQSQYLYYYIVRSGPLSHICKVLYI